MPRTQLRTFLINFGRNLFIFVKKFTCLTVFVVFIIIIIIIIIILIIILIIIIIIIIIIILLLFYFGKNLQQNNQATIKIK